MKRFNLVSVVYNQQYLSFFLDVIIPNLLSQGNIPKCKKYYCLKYYIYTTDVEYNTILANKNFQNLSKIIPTEIKPIITGELIRKYNKYEVKGYCQAAAIKETIANNAIIVLINPDSLVSDGGLFNSFSLIDKEKKVVLIGELARVEQEAISKKLASYFNLNKTSLTINHHKLVDLGINNLHEIGKLLFWNKRPFSKWPGAIYWKINKNSLLAKFFHLHPLIIDLRNLQKDIPKYIMPDDGGLIEFLGFKRENIYVVEDSKEICCIEVSSKDMEPFDSAPLYTKNLSLYVFKWAIKHTLNSHRKNFCYYNLKFQGKDEVNWSKEIKKINKQLFLLRRLLRILTLCNFKKFGKKLGLHLVKRLLTRQNNENYNYSE